MHTSLSSPPLPSPQRDWGPGGYAVSVTADDEFELVTMLETLPHTCSRPTARQIAQYARGLDHFRATEGPRDAGAVGRALGLANGKVHDLLNPGRTHWNARAVRRKLVVAYMPDRVDAVVLKLTIHESRRKPYAIMTAFALGSKWRILAAAQRVRLDDRDAYPAEAHRARQALVDEVTQILTMRHLDGDTPLLTGDPTIVQHVLEYLIEADQLTFLAEVNDTWNYGGIVPVTRLDAPNVPLGAGGTMRELFPFESNAKSPRMHHIVLTAYTELLGPTAVAIGSFGSEQFFIGRSPGQEGAGLQAQAASREVVELAERFAGNDFSEIADDYRLGRFNCPGDDDRFQRHCTVLTLRDCFAARSSAA